jgi:hypothetical protein
MRFDGTQVRVVDVTATAAELADDTGGQTTCYQLVALDGDAILGRTDFLCAVPGTASPSPSERASPSSVFDRLRSGRPDAEGDREPP